jgi:beta-lactamase regulating signal transducer with metallopeptidase domain/protocatechuate 3,4-dioxygenase beta subunit
MIDFVNSSAESWFQYMSSATLQAILLALVVLAAVCLMRRRMPAMRHALLMIALLKFVVPPTLSLPSGLFSQLKPKPSTQTSRSVPYLAPMPSIVEEVLWPEEQLRVAHIYPPAVAPKSFDRPTLKPIPSLPAAKTRPTVKSWLMLLHILGAFVFIIIVIVEKARLHRLSMRAEAATDEGLLLMFDDLCGKMKLRRRKPKLLISTMNHSPMTFGSWNPVVVLPHILVATLPPEELKVILGHELAHQRRWDLWMNWLHIPLAAIWWFNPVYWLLSHMIRSVREDCCDDLVVASGLASGEAYCDALLQAARVASGCALTGAALAYITESHPLRRRLKRIMTSKLITAPRLAWTGIAIVILLALLFLPGIRKPSGRPNSNLQTQVAKTPEIQPANSSVPVQGNTQGKTSRFHVVEASTGRAIAGAALLVGSLSAIKDMLSAEAPHTDAEGNCSITIPAPPLWVEAKADGYVPRRLSFNSADDYQDEYVFKLEKGGFIGGYVHDEGGQPIENVKLAISSSNPTLQSGQRMGDREWMENSVYTQTDRSGRWTSTEVMPNPDRISLTLEHPEHGSGQFVTDPVPATTDFGSTIIRPTAHVDIEELKDGKAILVMKNGIVVSGRVMDEAGRGIGDCEINQFENPSGPAHYMLPFASTKTEPDGQFAFRILKPGEIVLAVQAKGFAPESRAVKVVPGLPALEFRLKKGEIVSGRVVDDSGNPVANASLRVSTQGTEQPFSWQGKTGDDGRFLWDSAPANPLQYLVSAAGYDPLFSVLLAPAKEHEIRLTKSTGLIVSGKVTDAKTKMPLNNFKVSALLNSQIVSKSVEGKGGEFTLTLQVQSTPAVIGGREMPMPAYGILVEADGYLPDLSQSVDSKQGSRYLEIALVPTAGFAGKVLLPDGSPVSGANVFLCGSNGQSAASPLGTRMMMSIKSIRSINQPSNSDLFTVTAVTDDSGRFKLKAVPQADSIFVTHEKGFAALTIEQYSASSNITLRPWGRVEGVLMVGSKPGVGQRIFLSPAFPSTRPPALSASFSAVTDGEGKFVYPTVPPGEYKVSHMVSAGDPGQSTIAAVRSGETLSLKLGGVGRPVIGRIVATSSDPNVTHKIRWASLDLKPPGEAITRPANPAALQDYYENEEVRTRMRAERSYAVAVGPDGSFRAEDIPSGTYILTVSLIPSDTQAGGPTRPDDRPTREIVIPEIPGGRSDDPLDLGIITLQLPPKK